MSRFKANMFACGALPPNKEDKVLFNIGTNSVWLGPTDRSIRENTNHQCRQIDVADRPGRSAAAPQPLV